MKPSRASLRLPRQFRVWAFIAAIAGLAGIAFPGREGIRGEAAHPGIRPETLPASGRMAGRDSRLDAGSHPGRGRGGGGMERGAAGSRMSGHGLNGIDARGGAGRGQYNSKLAAGIEKSVESGKPIGKSPSEMENRGLMILGLRGTPLLEQELKLFMKELTPDNWRSAIDTVRPLYDTLHHDTWGMMMQRLGVVGGQEAAEYFKPANMVVDYEGYGSRGIVRGWASIDGEAARGFVESLPEGRYRDGMGIGLILGITDGSAGAMELLYDQLPKTLWPQIAAAQRDQIRWNPGGGDAAVKGWLQEVEVKFGRESYRFRTSQETADLHFLEGAMWDRDREKVTRSAHDCFARSGDGVSGRVLVTALENYARFDPAAALNLADARNADLQGLQAGVSMVVRGWAERDLGAPGDWLNANPGSPNYNAAAEAYAAELKKEDPAAAAKWSAMIR